MASPNSVSVRGSIDKEWIENLSYSPEIAKNLTEFPAAPSRLEAQRVQIGQKQMKKLLYLFFQSMDLTGSRTFFNKTINYITIY